MMTLNFSRLWWWGIALLFGAVTLNAQVPQKVHDLEMIYRKEIVRINKELNEKYLVALEDLQKRYTQQKNFDAAIVVKREIERVNIYQAKDFSEIKVELPPVGERPSMVEKKKDPADLSDWKGEGKKVMIGDVMECLRMTAVPDRVVKISRVFDTKGAKQSTVTFRYRGNPEFKGEEKPLELRAVYSTGAFKFRQTTVIFDGEWREYKWPFSDFRGEDAIRFELLVLPGEGTVDIGSVEVDIER